MIACDNNWLIKSTLIHSPKVSIHYFILMIVTVSVTNLHVSVFYIASQKACKTPIPLAILKCFTPTCSLLLWPLMCQVVFNYILSYEISKFEKLAQICMCINVLWMTLPYSEKFWWVKTLANRSFQSFGEENVGEFIIANISYFSESGIWLG